MQKIIQKFKIDGQEIIFRYPKESDWKSILKLTISLFEEGAMVGFNTKPTKKDTCESLAKKLKSIKKKEMVYLVCDVAGQVKGRAWIKKNTSDCLGHIGDLGIHLGKDIRGKGVGDKLLKAIIKEAKKVLKIKIITLDVSAENNAAINLYEKNGFVKNGIIKGGFKYYKRFMDVIPMVRYL